MNVTVVYGTMLKTNTYNCVQLLLSSLKLTTNIEVAEFFLSKDSPYIHHENSSTLINDKYQHFHSNYIDPVVKSLDKADLIILACSVSTCDIPRGMKLFLNDLSYSYTKNKKNSLMCNKIGLVISTARGAGLFHTVRTLKKNLNFLGVNNILSFSKTVYEMNWKDMKLKTKKQINKKACKLSNKISKLYNNLRTSKISIINELTSPKTDPMLKNSPCNIIDLSYWKKHYCFHARN